MKTIKAYLKAVALLFSVLILFQGCTVYKKANITLEDAYKSKNRVKVTTNDNQKLKFKIIDFADGNYYGVEKKPQGIRKTLLDNKSIHKINEKNELVSAVLHLWFPITLVALEIILPYGLPSGYR